MDNLDEVKSAVDAAVDPVMRAFNEFKEANDARLSELEKKGAADPLLDEKISNIETSLSKFEDLNQKLTLAQAQAKKAAEIADRVEVSMARLPALRKNGAAGGDIEEIKSRASEFFRACVRYGTVGGVNLTVEERKCLEDAVAEYKALQVTADTAGGFLAPIDYIRELLKTVILFSPMRSLVTVRTTMMKSIQIPNRTGVFAAQWVAEQGTKAETTGLSYGLLEIPTHELYALVDISNQMLEDAAFDMEAQLREEAVLQFAVAEGAATISGNGVGKPEGFLSNSNITPIASGDANLITADGLINLFYGLKTAYARNATWIMNRSTLGAIRKLKDGEGNYLWLPGIAGGLPTPNTILGAPYAEMPDMPNVSAGTYPVAFGDWARGYYLVDRLAMEFLRDPYTQATSGNVRFVLRRRLGGQTVMPEAIKTLHISAA